MQTQRRILQIATKTRKTQPIADFIILNKFFGTTYSCKLIERVKVPVGLFEDTRMQDQLSYFKELLDRIGAFIEGD